MRFELGTSWFSAQPLLSLSGAPTCFDACFSLAPPPQLGWQPYRPLDSGKPGAGGHASPPTMFHIPEYQDEDSSPAEEKELSDHELNWRGIAGEAKAPDSSAHTETTSTGPQGLQPGNISLSFILSTLRVPWAKLSCGLCRLFFIHNCCFAQMYGIFVGFLFSLS